MTSHFMRPARGRNGLTDLDAFVPTLKRVKNRSRRPDTVDGAVEKMSLVRSDLALDYLEAVLEFSDPLADRTLVRLEQVEARLFVSGSGPD